jgi:hypothetical protein
MHTHIGGPFQYASPINRGIDLMHRGLIDKGIIYVPKTNLKKLFLKNGGI